VICVALGNARELRPPSDTFDTFLLPGGKELVLSLTVNINADSLAS